MRDDHADELDALGLPTVADYAAKIGSLWELPLPEAAAPKSQKELDEVVEQHRIWVQSLAEPGVPVVGRRAVLRGADLRGMSLARRDLRGADLAGANLEGASLVHANLRLADMTGANVKNADMRGAVIGPDPREGSGSGTGATSTPTSRSTSR